MKRFVALLLLVAAAACTSPRYVGSVGRDRTYVNRGYGFLVRLDHANLSERYDAVTAENLTAFPPAVRATLKEAPLDLDGDGFLDPTETTRFLEPALRLVSRTSSVVTIDVAVQIVPKRSKSVTLASMVASEHRMTTLGGVTPRGGVLDTPVKTSTVTPGFTAMTYEAPGRVVTLVDMPEFRAEEGIKRRQIVRVTLSATRVTPALREDHAQVLKALILNRRGSFETTKEQW
ncbi:MAG: hypothetical protein RMA76_44970 [Deltaproteobacteria bacterium]|jgi:hypothetical protein